MPRKTATPTHTIMEESDKSLLEAAESIFADDLVSSQPEELDLKTIPPIDEGKAGLLASTKEAERPDFGRPTIGDMITVRGGGLYLPVRRRVGWMRGEPQPHPNWTIDTIAEKVIEGTLKKSPSGKMGTETVEGGYARYRANLFDEHGRLISTGTKTEYSERFTDFAEKAECLPDNVEILTLRGFKHHNELTIGEEVAAYDTHHDRLVWTQLQRVVTYDDAGVVQLANHHAFSVTCTPAHTWAVNIRRSPDGHALLRRTDQLRPGDSIVLAAMGPEGGTLPVSTDQAALMGWAITDGSFRRKTANHLSIIIHQSKERFIEALRALLIPLGAIETVAATGSRTFPSGRTYTTLPQYRWRLPATSSHALLAAFGIEHESQLPNVVAQMPAPARQAMLDAIMAGDGDGRGHLGIKRRPWVLDVFAILATLQGIAVTSIKERANEMRVQRLRKTRMAYVSHMEITDAGSTQVWCPTTAHGTWVARFPSGLVSITGNTGAIGRALAVAGYGTEAAVDLDEGLEKERIADAPVMPAGRPINITPSAVPGVKPGGRPAKITNAQVGDIARLNKQLGLGYGLVSLMEGIKGDQMPPLEAGHENEQMRAFLETFSHDQAGLLVQQLTKALADKKVKEDEQAV